MEKNSSVRKIKPPIDPRLIKFRFPGVKRKTLANGLTLLVIEQPKVPKVYFRLGFDFGSKTDPEEKAGLNELLAATLKKGTRKYMYREIVDLVDFMGAELEVMVSEDFFFVFGEFLSEFVQTGLELVSEVVLRPQFPAEELEKERAKAIANLENEKSSPHFLAHRRMNRVMFNPHPYSRYKTIASLQNIEREDLQLFWQNYFVPGHAYLVLAGDVREADALDWAEKYFGEWEPKKQPDRKIASPSPVRERTVYLVNRPGSAQSTLLLGNRLFPRNHPDYEKMLVMNKILGGSASGRLFMYLREEKGYTYSASSYLYTLKEAGSWQASAEVRTEMTAQALEGFLEQFQKIRHEAVSPEELENAKRYLVGIFPLQNETPSSIAALGLRQYLYDLPENYWDHYLDVIEKVDREDVMAVTRQYLDLEHLAIVVVGDGEKIDRELENFGTVQIFDVEDRRIR